MPKTKTKNLSGRKPKYGENMKVYTVNMPPTLHDRLDDEAKAMNKYWSELMVMIAQWYVDAVDRQRGGAEDFDNLKAKQDMQAAITK